MEYRSGSAEEMCPYCQQPLRAQTVECYQWRPENEEASVEKLGIEKIFRCMICEDVFFSDIEADFSYEEDSTLFLPAALAR